MRAAIFMSDEMIERLFAQFKSDHKRWNDFMKLEFPAEPYSEHNIEHQSGRAAIVEEFVRERLGADHDYEVGGLIIKIQKAMHGF